MKGLPICFSEVQVKNDVTDNNNKHFVTAFEGECRNIIELREHLKLCFLIILGLGGCWINWKRAFLLSFVPNTIRSRQLRKQRLIALILAANWSIFLLYWTELCFLH